MLKFKIIYSSIIIVKQTCVLLRGVTMEKDYLIKTIKELLSECTDIDLLYLIVSLLSDKG
jgi:hypothetical protein